MAWWNQRSDIQFVEVYRAIQKYGYNVQWEKASRCSCIPTDGTAQPDFTCPLCKGKGWYWYDPLFIQGIMTNFSENLRYNQTGEILAGMCYFTTFPEYKLNNWDRITNFHSQIRYGQIITKGERGGADKLRFKPIDIISLRTVDDTYEKKIDFIFDEEKAEVNWLPTGKEPLSGYRYSVEYYIHPSWIIVDITNVIRDTLVKSKKPGVTYQPLPQRATCRLEYFVFDQ